MAATSGNLSQVRLLINLGANPDPPAGEVGTPLLEATRKGHEEVVRALCSMGVNVLGQAPFPKSGADHANRCTLVYQVRRQCSQPTFQPFPRLRPCSALRPSRARPPPPPPPPLIGLPRLASPRLASPAGGSKRARTCVEGLARARRPTGYQLSVRVVWQRTHPCGVLTR